MRGFRDYLKILDAVVKEGVDCFIFCDTNGGTLPHEITNLLTPIVEKYQDQSFGVHFQNDNGCNKLTGCSKPAWNMFKGL